MRLWPAKGLTTTMLSKKSRRYFEMACFLQPSPSAPLGKSSQNAGKANTVALSASARIPKI